MINSLSLYLSQYQELFGDDLFIKNKKNKNKKKLINNLIFLQLLNQVIKSF